MKKAFPRLTAIVTILFLVIAIPVTVYLLQNQKFNFQINAFLNDEPQSVNVVDKKGSSVEITWMTEKSVIGMVRITGEVNNVTLEKTSSNFHSLKITNLQPGKDYSFILLSDGVEYTKPEYNFKTASFLDAAGTPYIVYGQVFGTDGVSLQSSGIAYIKLKTGDIESEKIPAVLNKVGGFQADLMGILTNSQNGLFGFKNAVDISVEIYYAIGKPSITKVFTMDLSNNHQIPNIYLGDVNIDIIPGVNGN